MPSCLIIPFAMTNSFPPNNVAAPISDHSQSNTVHSKDTRLAFLDSLRGWAALYVLMYHTALIPQPPLQVPAWAATIVLNGGTGVTLFFIVSAFSLCHAHRADDFKGIKIASFFLKRLFRIAPLFYVVLGFSLLRDFWLFGVGHDVSIVAANLLFAFNLWPGQETGIAWASWTIGVEVLFYTIFPFLVLRARHPGSAILLVVFLLIFDMIYNGSGILAWLGISQEDALSQAKYGVLHHLPTFAFGILAYRLFAAFIERRSLSVTVGGSMILIGLYLYIGLARATIGPAPFHDAYYWQSVVFVLITLGCSICPSRFVVNRISRVIGKISYSVYLVHPTVVFLLSSIYYYVQRMVQPSASYWICFFLTLAVTCCISVVTYRTIELPGIRLGNRVIASIALRLNSSVS